MSAPRIVIGLADDIAYQLARDDKFDGMSLHEIADHFTRTEQQRFGRLLELLAQPEYAQIRATRLLEGDGTQPSDSERSRLRMQARLEEGIRAKSGRPVPTLLGLFVLENVGDEAAAEVLLRRLRELLSSDPVTGKRVLGTAYIDEDVGLARQTGAGNPPNLSGPHAFYPQPYLGRSGINLPILHSSGPETGWQHYDGTGVQVIDVEEDWSLDHEAFNQKVRDQSPGASFNSIAAAHGNAVLGIVTANGSSSKIRGIAPGCTVKGLYRLKDEVGRGIKRLEAAITEAVKNLEAGDVLLLPLQIPTTKLPVEVMTDIFYAIVQAVRKGIIVIEAAGNEAGALEYTPHLAAAWKDVNGENDSFGDRHGLPDSGAIMVSGCFAPQNLITGTFGAPQQDLGMHSGARIDCCAWSKTVYTSFSVDPHTYEYFHDTSAATPIIAGLALIVQQCAKKRLGRPLTPFEMRELFCDAACGTLVNAAGAPPVSMPDACKLFAKVENM